MGHGGPDHGRSIAAGVVLVESMMPNTAVVRARREPSLLFKGRAAARRTPPR